MGRRRIRRKKSEVVSETQAQALATAAMREEVLRGWNETVEKFRYYNDGSEEDILEMIDDFAAERDELADMNGEE
jgi:hypothetical protein